MVHSCLIVYSFFMLTHVSAISIANHTALFNYYTNNASSIQKTTIQTGSQLVQSKGKLIGYLAYPDSVDTNLPPYPITTFTYYIILGASLNFLNSHPTSNHPHLHTARLIEIEQYDGTTESDLQAIDNQLGKYLKEWKKIVDDFNDEHLNHLRSPIVERFNIWRSYFKEVGHHRWDALTGPCNNDDSQFAANKIIEVYNNDTQTVETVWAMNHILEGFIINKMFCLGLKNELDNLGEDQMLIDLTEARDILLDFLFEAHYDEIIETNLYEPTSVNASQLASTTFDLTIEMANVRQLLTTKQQNYLKINKRIPWKYANFTFTKEVIDDDLNPKNSSTLYNSITLILVFMLFLMFM